MESRSLRDITQGRARIGSLLVSRGLPIPRGVIAGAYLDVNHSLTTRRWCPLIAAILIQVHSWRRESVEQSSSNSVHTDSHASRWSGVYLGAQHTSEHFTLYFYVSAIFKLNIAKMTLFFFCRPESFLPIWLVQSFKFHSPLTEAKTGGHSYTLLTRNLV